MLLALQNTALMLESLCEALEEYYIITLLSKEFITKTKGKLSENVFNFVITSLGENVQNHV